MFSTNQAAKALCLNPISVRRYRLRRGMGTEALPGRLAWSFAEMEEIRRIQAKRWGLPQWNLTFQVKQLDGTMRKGAMLMWAATIPVAESKGEAWFWDALLKEQPEKWGTPVEFKVLDAKWVDSEPQELRSDTNNSGAFLID